MQSQETKKKQGGFVLTSELIMLVTILVIGLTVGMVTVRDGVTGELNDVAEAIGSVDQSYHWQGIINSQNTAEVAGSSFGDGVDTLAGDEITWSYFNADPTELGANVGVAQPDLGNGVNANSNPIAP